MITERMPDSGRLSRAGDKEFAPAKVRRLRDAAWRRTEDVRYGSELGRVNLAQQFKKGKLVAGIDDTMYAAGVKWAETVADYHQAIAALPLKSAALERGAKSEPPSPDSARGVVMARRERLVIERMKNAYAALLAAGGVSIVRAVVENDQACGWFEMQMLRHALTALAEHWNLSRARRS